MYLLLERLTLLVFSRESHLSDSNPVFVPENNKLLTEYHVIREVLW